MELQGVRALPATRTVLLNNDVVGAGGLASRACWRSRNGRAWTWSAPLRAKGNRITRIRDYARQYVQKMAGVKRLGLAFGFCFMVHRRVFEKAGLFYDDLRLERFHEDDEFFRRSRQAGFRLGVTGGSFLHHIGSATQVAIKSCSRRGPCRARRPRLLPEEIPADVAQAAVVALAGKIPKRRMASERAFALWLRHADGGGWKGGEFIWR